MELFTVFASQLEVTPRKRLKESNERENVFEIASMIVILSVIVLTLFWNQLRLIFGWDLLSTVGGRLVI